MNRNYGYLYPADLAALGINVQVVVAGAPDTTPPQLLGLTIDRSFIDTSASAQQVTFTWNLEDDLSGLPGPSGSSPTQMRLRSPSGGQFVTTVLSASDLIAGDLLHGTFRDTVTFPMFSESGEWRVDYLRLADAVGNSQYLYSTDLAAMGIHVDVTVTPEPSTLCLCVMGSLALGLCSLRRIAPRSRLGAP